MFCPAGLTSQHADGIGGNAAEAASARRDRKREIANVLVPFGRGHRTISRSDVGEPSPRRPVKGEPGRSTGCLVIQSPTRTDHGFETCGLYRRSWTRLYSADLRAARRGAQSLSRPDRRPGRTHRAAAARASRNNQRVASVRRRVSRLTAGRRESRARPQRVGSPVMDLEVTFPRHRGVGAFGAALDRGGAGRARAGTGCCSTAAKGRSGRCSVAGADAGRRDLPDALPRRSHAGAAGAAENV